MKNAGEPRVWVWDNSYVRQGYIMLIVQDFAGNVHGITFEGGLAAKAHLESMWSLVMVDDSSWKRIA